MPVVSRVGPQRRLCRVCVRGGVSVRCHHPKRHPCARPPATQDSDSEGPELSDWEKYAAEEYDILVAEEAAADPWDDG